MKQAFLPLKRFYKSKGYTVEKKTEQEQRKAYGEEKAYVQLQELKKKFCNLLMRNGEKSKAYKLFYESLKQVEDKTRIKKATTRVCLSSDTSDTQLFDLLAARKKKENDNQEEIYDSLEFGSEQGIRTTNNLLQIHSQSQKTENQQKGYVDQQRKGKKNNSVSLKGGNKKDSEYFYNEFLRKNTLYQAVENVKPPLELRRVRKGGTTYQVPAIVSQKRQERLAIKWIIESAEKRKKKSNSTFCNCLVSEILDAFNKTGQPRQRRDEQLKVAEFNRAYTRYRWW